MTTRWRACATGRYPCSASSTTPRPPPAPTTPTTSSTNSLNLWRTGRAECPSAEADRHQEDPDHRVGAHHHRAGVRVRLLRHAGLQGAEERGLQSHPRD